MCKRGKEEGAANSTLSESFLSEDDYDYDEPIPRRRSCWARLFCCKPQDEMTETEFMEGKDDGRVYSNYHGPTQSCNDQQFPQLIQPIGKRRTKSF